jgi:hypothetical protein
MSNNAPDYQDNLVFPPQDIKSQDDVKHQDTRSSDVLIKAVEKCEKLEIQLGIIIEILLRECPQYEGYVRANFPTHRK